MYILYVTISEALETFRTAGVHSCTYKKGGTNWGRLFSLWATALIGT